LVQFSQMILGGKPLSLALRRWLCAQTLSAGLLFVNGLAFHR
jgi:hypothetical protein